MKISFAITVCNELEEIKKLVPFILKNKRPQDEIVVLFDSKNGDSQVLDFLLPYNKLPNVQTWRCFDWNNNFADWKNILNSYCDGDYIYQLDADEMVSEYIIKNLHTILEMNPSVDLIFVPRMNTVTGITQDHINKWGWNVNEKGFINFPDMQGRIYRKNMSWYGKVHERIIGGERFSSLPYDEEYCIQHHKTIQRQEKQNNYYGTI
jgi:glycosyltransferase involved in cell wall biosynthesis